MAKRESKAEKAEKIDQLSFEQCLEQLQRVVDALEDGNTGLSESLVEYERGVAYLKQCHKLLESAEHRVQMLSGVDADGNLVTQRFDESPMSLEEKASTRSRRRTRKPSSRTTESDNGRVDDVDDGATLF